METDMEQDDVLIRKFQKELNSGTVSLVLLSLIERAGAPTYGYQIARRLVDAAGGDLPMKQGTIYPVLRSLAGLKLLASEVEPSVAGPPRRYYTITKDGREVLVRWRRAWRRTRDLVEAVLGPDGSASAADHAEGGRENA